MIPRYHTEGTHKYWGDQCHWRYHAEGTHQILRGPVPLTIPHKGNTSDAYGTNETDDTTQREHIRYLGNQCHWWYHTEGTHQILRETVHWRYHTEGTHPMSAICIAPGVWYLIQLIGSVFPSSLKIYWVKRGWKYNYHPNNFMLKLNNGIVSFNHKHRWWNSIAL